MRSPRGKRPAPAADESATRGVSPPGAPPTTVTSTLRLVETSKKRKDPNPYSYFFAEGKRENGTLC